MPNYTTKCDREALAEQIRTLAGKHTTKQIAEKLNHTPRYIMNVACVFDISLKRTPPLDAHDMDLIVQLIQSGLPRREIAEKFEISEPTLSRHLANHFNRKITTNGARHASQSSGQKQGYPQVQH